MKLIFCFVLSLYLLACGDPSGNIIDMNRLRPPAPQQIPVCQIKIIDESFCAWRRDGFEYSRQQDFCTRYYDKQCDEFWYAQHERRHSKWKAPRGEDTGENPDSPGDNPDDSTQPPPSDSDNSNSNEGAHHGRN